MKTIDFTDWCAEADRKGETFFFYGAKYTLCDYSDNIEGQSCYVVYNHETNRHSVWQWYNKRKVVVYDSII